MDRKKTTTLPGSEWLDIQKKYLEACRAFNQFIPGIQGNADQYRNPLTEAMEHWWQSVAPLMPEDKTEFVSKILEQGRTYYFLGDQFIKLLNETSKAGKAGYGWEKILNKQFEEMKAVFSKMQNDAQETAHKMAGAWQLMPMDTLQRTFSLGSIMPGDFLGDLKHAGFQQVSDKFLSIPGVGYTRESQEHVQHGIRSWNEYQKVFQEYNQAMFKVGMEAIEAMRQKILAMAKEGKELKSLRELYDLWIDCNEEAYASFVFTPEYSDLYGRLTNALMAVKQHGRNIVDESLGSLNIPTYKGINTLQKRQYDMAREQKAALKKIQALEQEITVLRSQFKSPVSADVGASSLRHGQNRTNKVTAIHSDYKRKRVSKKSSAGKKKVKQGKKAGVMVIKL